MRIRRALRWSAILAVAAAALALFPPGLAEAAPAPPPGWTLTWADDFNGCAGCGVDTSSWIYDTGTGFGTGEIETMTNSTSNVFQDGAGHLVIRALHSGTAPTGGWTSGRIETQLSSFGASPGGVVMMQSLIQQPNLNTSNGPGYWPAFWMLGAPLRSGVPWPTSGEVDILEDVNSQSLVYGTLHCGVFPGGPCNESRLPDRFPHLRGPDRPLRLAGADPLVPGRQQLLHRLVHAGGPDDLGERGRPPVLHHLRPGHGWGLPERGLRLHHADLGDRVGRPDERRLRRRLQQDARFRRLRSERVDALGSSSEAG